MDAFKLVCVSWRRRRRCKPQFEILCLRRLILEVTVQFQTTSTKTFGSFWFECLHLLCVSLIGEINPFKNMSAYPPVPLSRDPLDPPKNERTWLEFI